MHTAIDHGCPDPSREGTKTFFSGGGWNGTEKNSALWCRVMDVAYHAASAVGIAYS